MIAIFLSLVFFSGLTGLIYQVTWQKYLSVLLGSHAAATSIVLALFFMFLAAGYFILGRYSSRLNKNQLFLYAIFEFFIGLYALYSPALFRFLFDVYTASDLRTEGQNYWFGLVLSGVFIFIPTFLMGGTLPVLVQGLSANLEVSAKRHAQIYAINTLGAFAGCVLAGFWLIERFGLEDTLFIAAWTNLLIGIVAFAAVKRAPAVTTAFSQSSEQVDATNESGGARSYDAVLLGFISFASGFYVFAFEKIIIRLAGLIFGSSTYTYSIVVSAFILAIGIGSLILSRFQKYLTEKIFVLNLFLSVLSMTALYRLVPALPDMGLRLRLVFQSSLINFTPYWLTVLAFSLLLLLIPIGLLGMNLPFLFSLIRKRHQHLAKTVGNLYSINCLGSAVGAIVGGYWLFQFFRAETVFRISITVLVISALLTAVYFLRSRRLLAGTVGALAAVLAFVWLSGGWPDSKFTPGLYLVSSIAPTATDINEVKKNIIAKPFLFSVYDPNTYVTVTQENEKDLALYVNGKPDAMTSGDHFTRALAVLVPVALSSQPVKEIFIAGLGAGLSMSLATKFSEVENVRVAEISKGVVDALPYFKNFNYEVEKRESKYSIDVGDAYKVLMSSTKKYDLIVCEPSNLWVTGTEKLFSLEFYDIVAARLGPNGIFAQWFPLFGSDPETFLTILNTYAQKFKYVSIWAAGGGSALTIIGSQNELTPNMDLIKKRFDEMPDLYRKFGIAEPVSVLYNQFLTPAQVQLLLLKVEEKNSVFAPILEYKAGRAFFAGLSSSITTILIGKALLPIPQNMRSILPIWYDMKIPFSGDAVMAANKTADVSYRLRINLLNFANIKNDERFKEIVTELYNYRFLLKEEPAPKFAVFKSGADVGKLTPAESNEAKKNQSNNLVSEVDELARKARLLMAIGLVPKLSQLSAVIDANCPAVECSRTKLKFLSWFAAPSVWKETFSQYDPEKLNQAQIADIDREYLSVQNNLRAAGSF